MAQPILIFCFLSLVWLVNGVPFDFFQLVQQWGPSTCNNTDRSKCYAQPQPMFTIHGLWPTNYSNVPLVCPPKQFKKVPTLEQELNKYWPDVIDGDNPDFWTREWKKHGACSDPPFTIDQYFKISLQLRKRYDLLKILNDKGVSPQMSKNLVAQDILSPIKNQTGKDPAIHCNKNGKTKNLQLYEIVLCFDNKGGIVIDCPPFLRKSCQSSFVWLLPQKSSVGGPDYP